ncbi:xylose ABC transporter ATP-binding protein [Telmatospirillum siberiense]|uniref:D-xylose ABC transporter ATP-binding protein n=1 Tax=Telmatospirillum siberiense TaxID=382514 RepID=A0A2N3PX46_9PROT|nr:xylose ABC transporter ATP-binding protein [Telmatospirillum siberiense]PKU24955.1 D-xylose ABC transporter ATP-binding protein [Telmatospirillum siberiense]
MAEYLLEMRGIVKEFSGVKAVDGIDLKVRRGEVMALCGENGAGKSTLVKVLSAVYPYGTWDGTILWEGRELKASSIRDTERAGIVIIHQELMLVPQLSVAENIFLGHEPTLPGGLIDFETMYSRAAQLMAEVGMPQIKTALPVSYFGGGQQQLIEIAKALNKNAKLLILDEPSSSLTKSEIDGLLRLIDGLRAKGTACVYISHKLEEVAAIADRVTVIRDGTLVGTAPMADLSVDEIIRMMVGREIKNLYPREPHPVGDVIFEARGITCYDIDNPAHKRVDNVSFTLRHGEILGIAGLIGAGRTELVSALFGAYPGRSEGEIRLDGEVLRISSPRAAVAKGICMVPEDRKHHGIVPQMAIGHNITLSTLPRFAPSLLINEEVELQAMLEEIRRLGIKAGSPALPISSLSGGNQQKAVISKMLMPLPRILILDEPTRGVDVGAKYEIYKLMFELARQGMSIIMVSSELPEILGISDRVLVMGEGQLRGDFINESLTQEKILAAAITQLPLAG